MAEIQKPFLEDDRTNREKLDDRINAVCRVARSNTIWAFKLDLICYLVRTKIEPLLVSEGVRLQWTQLEKDAGDEAFVRAYADCVAAAGGKLQQEGAPRAEQAAKDHP